MNVQDKQMYLREHFNMKCSKGNKLVNHINQYMDIEIHMTKERINISCVLKIKEPRTQREIRRKVSESLNSGECISINKNKDGTRNYTYSLELSGHSFGYLLGLISELTEIQYA